MLQNHNSPRFLPIQLILLSMISCLLLSMPVIAQNTQVTPEHSIGVCIQRPTTEQFVPWHRDPGVRGVVEDHIPTRVVRLDANGQDQLDDSASFDVALNAVSAGGIVDIPEGTYYLSKPLQLNRDNQIIRGAGSNRTHLIFTESQSFGIAITGEYPDPAITVMKGEYGSSSVLVEPIRNSVIGNYGVLTNSESLHSQVISIKAQRSVADQTELLLSDPLNSTFNSGASLQIFNANEFSGIEALSVDVISSDTHIGDMIHKRSVAHGWIRDVESRRARQAHVFTRQTYNCEITDSVFLDATGHGDGKQGYGIDLANSTTGCLVENNTLGYLRHSILLNASANGNVVAFNHSFMPRHTNFFEGGPGDISFHGFSYANLVEGNVVERIHVGDSGAVGEGNLIHRNCLTSGPLTVGNSPDAVQSLYSNSMYGSNGQLQATFMPPVLPESPVARPYLQPGATLFDDDGITISPVAAQPAIKDNWYKGERQYSFVATPDSYYGTRFNPLSKSPATGNWMIDCRIPALLGEHY